MNVMQDIGEWIAGRPYWEQLAFEKVTTQPDIQDIDREELLAYFLEDNGLAERRLPRPQLAVTSSDGVAADGGESHTIMSISNLVNINALALAQTIEFSPALTAIYGANGSGKSGYARVLGCAGFSRGDKAILADVTRPASGKVHQSATIRLTAATGLRR